MKSKGIFTSWKLCRMPMELSTRTRVCPRYITIIEVRRAESHGIAHDSGNKTWHKTRRKTARQESSRHPFANSVQNILYFMYRHRILASAPTPALNTSFRVAESLSTDGHRQQVVRAIFLSCIRSPSARNTKCALGTCQANCIRWSKN